MTVVILPLTINAFGFVVALPTIASSLHGGTTDLAWVLNVAILFFGASVMVTARLADILGRKRILLGGIAVLTLASVGCALAPSIRALTAFRALEGLGMGMVYGAALPHRERLPTPVKDPQTSRP